MNEKEGDWEILQNIQVLIFDNVPKAVARTMKNVVFRTSWL
jgi:hypothetical protein